MLFRRIGASIDLKDVAIKISEENSPVLDCAFQLAIQASVLPDAFTKSCVSTTNFHPPVEKGVSIPS